MSNLQSLTQYDKKLPNKTLLQTLYVVGIILNTIAILSAIALFVWWLKSMTEYAWYYQNEGLTFTPRYFFISLGLLVLGIALVAGPGDIFKKYYRRVYQGKVIDKDTESGGSLYSHYLYWSVTVKGYTYANELRCYRTNISAGHWQQMKIGDYVTLLD